MADTDGPPGRPVLQSRAEVPPLLPYLAEVYERRHFTWALAAGDLRGKHLDTLLGNVWHLLNPILLITVYFVVFGVLLQTDRGVEGHFIEFLAIGIFTFSFCQRTVLACTTSIPNNIGLIRSLQFPRAVLPLSTVLVELASYALGFVVMVAVLLLSGEYPRLSWVLAPVVVVLLTMFSAGLGLIVARLGEGVRDVSQLLPYVFRMALYVSGIIFAVSGFITPEAMARFGIPLDAATVRQLFVLNPFFTYVDLLRDLLMTNYTAEYPRLEWIYVLVSAPVTLVAGLQYFRGGEKDYGRG